jgi:DNA-binding transcriptional regulator YdaS (Cro superfamily)
MDVHSTLYTTRGAVTAVAKRLGISDAAVSRWKTRGIPPNRAAEVETALRDYVAEAGRRAAPAAKVA